MADNVYLKNFYQNIMQKKSLMFGHQFLVELQSRTGKGKFTIYFK